MLHILKTLKIAKNKNPKFYHEFWLEVFFIKNNLIDIINLNCLKLVDLIFYYLYIMAKNVILSTFIQKIDNIWLTTQLL